MTFDDIKNFRGEVWKQLTFKAEHHIHPNEEIYISNYGRLVKIEGNSPKLFEAHTLNGYPHIKVKTTKKRKYKTYERAVYKGYYLHKLVAQTFLDKKEDDKFVIHLDYDKLNNQAQNLKWATKYEKEQHQWKNPTFIEAKKQNKRPYAKLTENNVRLIKKMLNDPDRRTRLKIIAKQFGVSTYQLHRIKTGENWADVPSL